MVDNAKITLQTYIFVCTFIRVQKNSYKLLTKNKCIANIFSDGSLILK